jgi:hypothetical protein
MFQRMVIYWKVSQLFSLMEKICQCRERFYILLFKCWLAGIMKKS